MAPSANAQIAYITGALIIHGIDFMKDTVSQVGKKEKVLPGKVNDNFLNVFGYTNLGNYC
jgi:hypothetical protein